MSFFQEDSPEVAELASKRGRLLRPHRRRRLCVDRTNSSVGDASSCVGDVFCDDVTTSKASVASTSTRSGRLGFSAKRGFYHHFMYQGNCVQNDVDSVPNSIIPVPRKTLLFNLFFFTESHSC